MLNDIIFECRKIKTRKKDLRNFGLTIGIILLWLSAFLTLYTGYDYVKKGIGYAYDKN